MNVLTIVDTDGDVTAMVPGSKGPVWKAYCPERQAGVDGMRLRESFASPLSAT